ncbi:MAG: amidohydrolase family protein [Holdemanella sp.]|nr:amidohydrolase family protein [Holdemanella sp.]
MYTLSHCHILDGTKHMTVQKDMNIIVDGEKIVEISKEVKGKEINCEGMYVIPGLINLHVHLPGSGYPKKRKQDSTKLAKLALANRFTRTVTRKMCENYAKIALRSGVTTIRCVGGLGTYDTTIRDNTKLEVPRMLVSNRAITTPGGHMDGSVAIAIDSAGECMDAFDLITKEKVDLIKIMVTGGVMDATKRGEPGVVKMSDKYISLICSMAHKKGLKVAAHVESTQGIEIALRCGVDTIEHGAVVTDAILELYKEKGAAVICTLSPAIPYARFDRNLTGIDEFVQFNGNVVLNGIIDNARKGIKHGIPVGLGTDTACPFVTHYNMYRELIFFEKLVGVSKSFALYSATLNNARIAGIDDITGSIEVGKSADLVFIKDNPLKDLNILSTPSMVFIQGKQVQDLTIKKNKKVDELLDEYIHTLN